MCTVSWLHRKDGYVLLCNRDERHTRKPASGPRLDSLRGVSFIAPVDGDHGGSWIGVNQFGLTLCLLNTSGATNATAYSVCMHRNDASGVSLSVVTVTPETVEFSYHSNSPCLPAPTSKVFVERAAFCPQVAAL